MTAPDRKFWPDENRLRLSAKYGIYGNPLGVFLTALTGQTLKTPEKSRKAPNHDSAPNNTEEMFAFDTPLRGSSGSLRAQFNDRLKLNRWPTKTIGRHRNRLRADRSKILRSASRDPWASRSCYGAEPGDRLRRGYFGNAIPPGGRIPAPATPGAARLNGHRPSITGWPPEIWAKSC